MSAKPKGTRPTQTTRPNRSSIAVLVASTTLGLVHCSDPEVGDPTSASSEQPIINGATGPARNGDVAFNVPSGGCSGTMVNSFWFLTAAHCVAGLTPNQVTTTTVYDGASFTFATVEEIVVSPYFAPPSSGTDVALLRLSLAGADVNGSPVGFTRPIYAGATTALNGTTVYCSGQGFNSFNAATDSGSGAGFMRWTNSGVTVSSPTSTSFITNSNGAGQIQSFGDSGGGCYTSTGTLVGITISATRTSTIAGVQSVEAFRDWMRQVLASRIGVFNNGQWWLDRNGTRAWEGSGPSADTYYASFGPGLKPVTWNTGYSQPAVPRLGATRIGAFASTGVWYRDENYNGIWEGVPPDYYISVFGGATGDQPVTAQWSGAHLIDEVGVFRGAPWYLDANANNVWNGAPPDIAVSSFGSSSFQAVAGDWSASTGIGRIGVFSNGSWWLDINGDGAWSPGIDVSTSFGQPGDKPVVGDWNGDGNDKIGVYNSGNWWLDANGDFTWGAGDIYITGFGQPTDTPVAGRW